MWTKQYIFRPTKEEYFKTKHPIVCASVLLPIFLYYFVILFADNSWWMLVGFVGSIVLGIGLGYAFAVKLKIYQKVMLPVLCLISGVILIVVSLLFLF